MNEVDAVRGVTLRVRGGVLGVEERLTNVPVCGKTFRVDDDAERGITRLIVFGPLRLSALFGVSDLLLTYRLLFGNTFRAPSSEGVRNGPPIRSADRELFDDL
jgi:hypothetical protein